MLWHLKGWNGYEIRRKKPHLQRNGIPGGSPPKRRRYSKSVRRVVAASVTLLSILAVCCIAVGGYGWYLLNKINIDDDGGSLPSDFSYPEGEGPESIPDISFDSDPYENATTVADIPVMATPRT